MWTDEDRAKALGYEHWLAGNCPRCGTRPEDWQDDDGQERREPAYQAVTRGCIGCEQRTSLEKHLPDAAKQAGAYVTFVPADEFDPAAEAARIEAVGTHRS